MDRRETVFALLALGAAPLAANAQQPQKVARIGYLSPSLSSSPRLREAFLQGLREHGYVDGRNVMIEYRDAEGKVEWEAPCTFVSHDISVLPNGNILLHTGPATIVEMTPEKKVVWQYTAKPKDG